MEDVGVRNWALSREDALLALDELERLGVAVLGGDVYRIIGRCFEPSFDSWHCDQNVDELGYAYLMRSTGAARTYIKSYGIDGAFFVLVPKV